MGANGSITLDDQRYGKVYVQWKSAEISNAHKIEIFMREATYKTICKMIDESYILKEAFNDRRFPEDENDLPIWLDEMEAEEADKIVAAFRKVFPDVM